MINIAVFFSIGNRLKNKKEFSEIMEFYGDDYLKKGVSDNKDLVSIY